MATTRETSHDDGTVGQNAVPKRVIVESMKRASTQIPVNLLVSLGSQFDSMQSVRHAFRELRAEPFSATLVKRCRSFNLA
jgi:hypothetical protein